MESDVSLPMIQFFKADKWKNESSLNSRTYKLLSGTLCEGQEDLVMVVNGDNYNDKNLLLVRAVGNGSVQCDNGSSFGNGSILYFVDSDYSKKITFTPDENSKVKSVTINGNEVKLADNSVIVGGTSIDTSVVVTFEDIVLVKHSLSIVTVGNGKVIYNGTEIQGNTMTFSVYEGANIVLDFIPDDENVIGDILVNGVQREAIDGKFYIDNVTQDIAIGVTFNSSPNGFPVPKYVDLGLSVKWATWDVGASNENEFGLYFGWGDTDGHMTSTNPSDYARGFYGDSIINTEFDVAHVKWGDGWRLPSINEMIELGEKCKWVYETRKSPSGESIRGYCVTSKKNGNSIFLPAAGYMSGTLSDRVNSYVLRWTGEMHETLAYPVYYRLGVNCIKKTNPRSMRTPLRAVYDGTIPVPKPDTPDIPTEDDGKAVDLGLSVKWSNVNLGAKTDTEDGYYIPWGCTAEPTNLDYSKNVHVYYDSSTKTYTNIGKDFNVEGDFKYDAARKIWGKTWRVPTQKEWSELWFKCKWIWVDNYKNSGVPGFVITGKNGNSIFLSASGWKSGPNDRDTLQQYHRYGGYWSSSLNLRNTDYGLNLQIGEDLSQENPNANPMPGTYREFGLSIRPVCD